MEHVTRALVAVTDELHEDMTGDSLDGARRLAAALPLPEPDRGKYLDALLALHAELSRLGRPEILNDIQDLVAQEQPGRTITKNQLRTHLYRWAKNRRQHADEG